MRSRHHARRDQAYVVTEARQSRSAEIAQRERRYLVMMGIRVICFIVTVILFLNHAGWLCIIPAAGAIALPYFAVVVANARRQVGGAGGFRAYEPQLPERYIPPDRAHGEPGSGQPGSGRPDQAAPGRPPAGEQSDGERRPSQ